MNSAEECAAKLRDYLERDWTVNDRRDVQWKAGDKVIIDVATQGLRCFPAGTVGTVVQVPSEGEEETHVGISVRYGEGGINKYIAYALPSLLTRHDVGGEDGSRVDLHTSASQHKKPVR